MDITAPKVSQSEAIAPPTPSAPAWKIKLLYDGDCPLCLREVAFLKQRDGGRGLIAFVNIADHSYDPVDHGGVDFAAAMERIHAVKADGTVIQNVEVFRQIYELLGLGWLYAPTRWPILGPMVDWLYSLWAHWRLRLTGRPSLPTILAQRAQGQGCGGDRCRLEG